MMHACVWHSISQKRADTYSAAHCNTLQHTPTHCSQHFTKEGWLIKCCTLQHTATHCNALHTAFYKGGLTDIALHTALSAPVSVALSGNCNTVQYAATCCNMLQRTATSLQLTCNTAAKELRRSHDTARLLQHAATCCNMLKSTNTCNTTAKQLKRSHDTATHTATHVQHYGVAMISRLLKIISLLSRISSLL